LFGDIRQVESTVASCFKVIDYVEVLKHNVKTPIVLNFILTN